MPNPTVGFLMVGTVVVPTLGVNCTIPAPRVLKDIHLTLRDVGGGLLEMTCTDETDASGTFNSTFCPVVTLYSACGEIPLQVIQHLNGSAFTGCLIDMAEQEATKGVAGPYCYCQVAKIEGYGADRNLLAVSATDQFWLMLNYGGTLAFTDATPIPYPNENQCSEKCMYDCLNYASTVDMLPLMVLFMAQASAM